MDSMLDWSAVMSTMGDIISTPLISVAILVILGSWGMRSVIELVGIFNQTAHDRDVVSDALEDTGLGVYLPSTPSHAATGATIVLDDRDLPTRYNLCYACGAPATHKFPVTGTASDVLEYGPATYCIAHTPVMAYVMGPGELIKTHPAIVQYLRARGLL